MHKKTAISFLQTAQWLNNNVAHHLLPIGLTAQQLKILSIVAQSPNKQATVNEIKAQMFDPMSNVSRLLNKLVEKGLIQKIRNQEDQRLVYIQITTVGIELLCSGKRMLDEGLSAVGKLEQEEILELDRLIKKIRS